MRSIRQKLFRFASVGFCLVLAACNGGGGGGGGGSSSSTNGLSLSTNAISFNAPNTSSTPSSQIIFANVTGVTSGTLYIKIVSTGPAVASVTNISITGSTAGQGTINPAPASTLGPGTYTSIVTVYACTTDPNCSSGQLAGSPQIVNVTYTVGTEVSVLPSQLSFSQVTGGATPLPQDVGIATSGGERWTATVSHPWIGISSSSGIGSGNVSVSVNPAGLGIGTYNGYVTVVAFSSGNVAIVNISLSVVVPAIIASSGSLTFDGIYGAPVSPQAINLSMNNGATVSWTAISGANWLLLGKTSGTTPDTLTINIDPSSLGAGSHTASITIAGNGLNGTTTINVSVFLAAPSLSVTPGSLSFGEVNGGLDSGGKTVQINLNTGTNAYDWTASSPDAWLQVSPSVGSISASPATVTATINPASIGAGVHNGTITFTALVNGITVNRTLPVDLRLDAHKILASDAGVALTSTPMLSKLTKTLKIRSNRGATINWSASSEQMWLSATSAGVTEGNLVLTANPSGLAVDTLHYANVIITSSDASVTNTETVRIGFWVGSTTPSAKTMLQGASAPMAVDPIRPYVYRYRNGSNSITVQNIYNDSIVGTITMPAGSQLIDAVIASDGSRLFVANYSDATIIPIDLPSFAVGTGWANGTPSMASLEYVRSNGIGLLISGNGRFINPVTGTAYNTTFTPASTYGVDTVRASYNGNLFCHQNLNLIPYTLNCRGLYMTSDTPSQVLLGAVTTGSGPSGTQIVGSDFAVNQKGTRVYVPSRNCCATGSGEFRVFDSTVSGTMPVIQTLNYFGNPNNAEVDTSGRIFLGSDRYGTATDVWVHDSNGSLLTSYELSGLYGGLLESSLMISGDGLRAVTSSDQTLLATTIGP